MLKATWRMSKSPFIAGAGIALAASATVLWVINGWDATLAITYLIAGGLITGVLVVRLTRRPQPTGPFAELLIPAHAHCNANQQELQRSDIAGCFFCLNIFRPQEEDIIFMEWVGSHDDGDWADDPVNGFAICPRCPVDSVIGSASGYPITSEFMEAMHR